MEILLFQPVHLPGPTGLDGPDLHCSFETYWCRNRLVEAGGLDEHHRWPISMGGPPEPTDRDGLLLLCTIHHRRQHALMRAMVQAGTTEIRTVRRFAGVELETATYGVTRWLRAGRPDIGGWPCAAAVLR